MEYPDGMKAWFLIAIGAAWLIALVAAIYPVVFTQRFAGVGIDLPLPNDMSGRTALILVESLGLVVLLGWIVPLAFGLRALFKSGYSSR